MDFDGFPTIHTDLPNQTLGEDQNDRRCDEEGFNTHIDQPCNGSGCVIGMNGAQDEMSGQGCLNSDLGCFKVSNLPHHDDIGILTEKGTEG